MFLKKKNKKDKWIGGFTIIIVRGLSALIFSKHIYLLLNTHTTVIVKKICILQD